MFLRFFMWAVIIPPLAITPITGWEEAPALYGILALAGAVLGNGIKEEDR